MTLTIQVFVDSTLAETLRKVEAGMARGFDRVEIVVIERDSMIGLPTYQIGERELSVSPATRLKNWERRTALSR